MKRLSSAYTLEARRFETDRLKQRVKVSLDGRLQDGSLRRMIRRIARHY